MATQSNHSKASGHSEIKSITVISRILATPVPYRDFPTPVVYESKYGYKRNRCPVSGCDYDGLLTGFKQHYARTHAPEWWGWHNKQIIKAIGGKR